MFENRLTEEYVLLFEKIRKILRNLELQYRNSVASVEIFKDQDTQYKFLEVFKTYFYATHCIHSSKKNALLKLSCEIIRIISLCDAMS